MLIMSRKQGQSVRVSEGIRITVVRIDNQTVRIGIEAPGDVPVARGELMADQSGEPLAALNVKPLRKPARRRAPAIAGTAPSRPTRQDAERSAPMTSSPSGCRSRQSAQRRTVGCSTAGIREPR